jgi:ABC-type uncharacterized transport system permease subunit
MIVTIFIFAFTACVFGVYTICALCISKRARNKFMNTIATRVALNDGQYSIANSFTEDDEEYMDFIEAENERTSNILRLAIITIVVAICTIISALLF